MYKKDIHPAESRLNKSDEQIEIVYTLEPKFRLGWKSVQLVTIKDQQYIRRLERDFKILPTEVELFITVTDCEWTPQTLNALLEELRDLEPLERCGLVTVQAAGQRLKKLHASGNIQA
jgi:hypothetical protein